MCLFRSVQGYSVLPKTNARTRLRALTEVTNITMALLLTETLKTLRTYFLNMNIFKYCKYKPNQHFLQLNSSIIINNCLNDPFFNLLNLLQYALGKKCPYSELFWPAFSRFRTEYGEILCISPYLVRMRENADQNNSDYGHFLRSDICRYLILF